MSVPHVPRESESELVAPRVVPYAWDQIHDARTSLLRLRDSKNNKRVAPSSLSGAQDVLQAAYIPAECAPPANPSVLCALPGDVITVMNTTHLQKGYLFYDEPVAPPSSSRSRYSNNMSSANRKTEAVKVEAPQKLSKEEEKEAERRRNLNTVAVAALPSAAATHAGATTTTTRQVFHRGGGSVASSSAQHQIPALQGALVSSIVNSAVVVYVLHDWNGQHRNVTRTSVHKVAPLPPGSWKRVSLAFNNPTSGERLFAVLRPSTTSGPQRSSLLVASRPLSDSAGKFFSKDTAAATFVTQDAGSWVAGPADIVWSGWIDATHPAVLDKKGQLYVYDLVNGKLAPQAAPHVVEVPIGTSTVTAACVARPPAASTNAAMLYTVLDGMLLHSFEFTWSVAQKRQRDDNTPTPIRKSVGGVSYATASSIPRVSPFHAALLPGFRVHSIMPGQGFAHQQPLLFVALETGGILVYHALHLEVLHQHAYRRQCKEEPSAVKLSFAIRERPDVQMCLLDEDIATILKAL